MTRRGSSTGSRSSAAWRGRRPPRMLTRWHDSGGDRHRNDPRLRQGLAVVAGGIDSLTQLLDRRKARSSKGKRPALLSTSPGVVVNRFIFDDRRSPVSAPGRVAFVYPGLGSYFAGMGRDLSALWPDLLRAQDSKNDYLRDQFDPETWWNGDLPRTFADHRSPILGQVSVGSLVTDLLRGLGVVPDAAIGYSLGETAALVALGAWTNRDEIASRLRSSPLFQTELAGPCEAARRVWAIPAWRAGRLGCRYRDVALRKPSARRLRQRAASTS